MNRSKHNYECGIQMDQIGNDNLNHSVLGIQKYPKFIIY